MRTRRISLILERRLLINEVGGSRLAPASSFVATIHGGSLRVGHPGLDGLDRPSEPIPAWQAPAAAVILGHDPEVRGADRAPIAGEGRMAHDRPMRQGSGRAATLHWSMPGASRSVGEPDLYVSDADALLACDRRQAGWEGSLEASIAALAWA